MTSPQILLFGDSHSYAVQRAIERREAKGRPSPLAAHRLRKVKNNIVMGDTSFEDFLVMAGRLRPEDVVLSMIGGNQHAVFSTVQHPQPFDFLLPGESADTIEKGVTLVPYRTLAQYFDTGIRGRDGKSLEALRKATRARIIHLLPPPPKRDNAHILGHHESKFAQDGIADLGVSPPRLRLKFWQLQALLLEQFCSSLDIEVMPPPAAAVDAEGYLGPDYYADDATHANAAYGELILDTIETRYAVDPVKRQAQ
jgi:hypothetical protein